MNGGPVLSLFVDSNEGQREVNKWDDTVSSGVGEPIVSDVGPASRLDCPSSTLAKLPLKK